MNQYFVDFDLPDEFTEDFVSLIPAQQKQVSSLLNDGTFLSYALSADRSKVWATVNAADEAELEAILNTLPLAGYMEATVYELEFYNAPGTGLPPISLN